MGSATNSPIASPAISPLEIQVPAPAGADSDALRRRGGVSISNGVAVRLDEEDFAISASDGVGSLGVHFQIEVDLSPKEVLPWKEAQGGEAKPGPAARLLGRGQGAETPLPEDARLRQTLITEMDRRRQVEALNGQLREQLQELERRQVPTRPARHHERRLQSAWFVILVIGLVVSSGVALLSWQRASTFQAASERLVFLTPAGEQFAADARRSIDRGDTRGGEALWRYALALDSERAEWWAELGHVLAARFEYGGAVEAYRRAVETDGTLTAAADGMAVCERLVRGQEKPGRPSEAAVYALHRMMMKHDRLAEASRMAALLTGDADLQQRTWHARLRKAGLDADVALDSSRRLSVVLRGRVQTKLTLLGGIPVVDLTLVDTDVSDISSLSTLPIESLNLAGTRVADLTPLRGLPLKRLNLARTPVEDILPLRELKLEELSLASAPVRSITAIQDSPLRRLDISGTRVSDIKLLGTTPLKELNLSRTAITDIAALAHMPLRILNLDDTGVTALKPLENSTISELSLARTPVTDLSPLARAPIVILNLAGCADLTDLSPLESLPKLQKRTLPHGHSLDHAKAILPRVAVIEKR